MKTTIGLLAMSTLMLSGCIPPRYMLSCTDTQSNHIQIMYGDSQIKTVPPNRDVHRGKYFEIRLHPDPGYEDSKVSVSGEGMDASWITGDATKNGTGKIVICTPDDVVLDKEYKYSVNVEGVGKLDPHVKPVP